MEYGLIGEHLGHSFSKEIHNRIGAYSYEIKELRPDEVESFILSKQFCGINVTIPYKQTVIPYLDEIDEMAKAIGAVNTVVNRAGKLYGYNTDFEGMRRMIKKLALSLENKKVLILGTGGTSKTAYAVARSMGAASIYKVSRTESESAISYETAKSLHSDADIIINTTPCGMYPHDTERPIDLDHFPSLQGVVDAIYHPLRTKLVMQALKKGIKACGGLYMLVAQAVCASEHFFNICEDRTNEIFAGIIAEKENIVLTGMPASGKTTAGKLLAERLHKQLIDTDEVIIQKAGMPITEIFRKYGEAYFRDLESEVILQVSRMNNSIIATGGGAVLRSENVEALKRNGVLFFLNRDPETLCPTDDRPTADSVAKMRALYQVRLPIYTAAADEIILDFSAPVTTAEQIERRFIK